MQRLVDTLEVERAQLVGRADGASAARLAKVEGDLAQLRSMLGLAAPAPAAAAAPSAADGEASPSDRLFDRMDTDGDGVVTMEEFVQELRSSPAPQPARPAAAAAPPPSPHEPRRQPEAARPAAVRASSARPPREESPPPAPRTKSKLVTNFDDFWKDAAAPASVQPTTSSPSSVAGFTLRDRVGEPPAAAPAWGAPTTSPAPARSVSPVSPTSRSPRNPAVGRAEAEAGRQLALEVGQLFESANVDILDAFASFDLDGDRRIDQRELEKGLHRLMPGLAATQMEWLIEVCDSDGDGAIDFYEFADHVGGMRRAAAASHSLARKSAQFWGEESPRSKSPSPPRFSAEEILNPSAAMPASPPAPAAPRFAVEEEPVQRTAQAWRQPVRAGAIEPAGAGGRVDSLVGQFVCVFYDGEPDRYGKVLGFDAEQDAHEITWAGPEGSTGVIFGMQPEEFRVVTADQMPSGIDGSAATRQRPSAAPMAWAWAPEPEPEPEPTEGPTTPPAPAPAPGPGLVLASALNSMDAFIAKSRRPEPWRLSEAAVAPAKTRDQHQPALAASAPAVPPQPQTSRFARGQEQADQVTKALSGSPMLQRQWDELGEIQSSAGTDQAFAQLDGDGDGNITMSELHSAFGGTETPAATAKAAAPPPQSPAEGVPATRTQSSSPQGWRQMDVFSPAPIQQQRTLSELPPAGAGPPRRTVSGYDRLVQQRRARDVLEKEQGSYLLASAKAALGSGDALARDRARRHAMSRKSETLISTISSSSTGQYTPRGASSGMTPVPVAVASAMAEQESAARCVCATRSSI